MELLIISIFHISKMFRFLQNKCLGYLLHSPRRR